MTKERMNAIPPPLRQLYVYLTQGCNLACRHCYLAPRLDPDGTHQPTLPVATLEAALDEAMPLGLTDVKLTGGEPLLHPAIGRILELVRARGLGLTLETNGVLLTPDLTRAIAAFSQPMVSVSLDGVDAATHDRIRGVPGTFEAAVAGVRRLTAAGIAPELIMTLMRDNVGQIAEMVRLAEALGARALKFNIVQPMARGAALNRSNAGIDIAELIDLCRWIDGDLAAGTSLSLWPHIPPAFLSLRRLFDGGSGRCGIFTILGLLPDGGYALCGVGQAVPELVFGQTGLDPLAEVWARSPLLRDLRRELPAALGGICGRCLMRDSCLGVCVANNYYLNHQLMAPFWFCAEAERLGLFPPSRIREG